jgi:glycosyltransferase involved in cell wall biosynthesis
MDTSSDSKLRIGMLAPITWPVPPTGYGPWEQVVSNLTEELVRLGHDVTLFAAPGSRTQARLVATVPHPLALWPEAEVKARPQLDPQSGLLLGPPDFRALEQEHIACCYEAALAGQFDVVHSHLHVHALAFSRLVDCPTVSTMHGAAWVRAIHPVLDRHRDQPFVSLSDAERTFKPDLNYVATVHNGIRMEDFPFCVEKEDYLLFAGRLSPEKGAAEAVEIARRSGRRLLLAGMIEPQYQDYFDQHVCPYVDGRQIEYLGLLSQRELVPRYQEASAVLFPIRWCEPFGLVGVEAQACGTPLIGTRYGFLPELIVDGRTGFVVDSIDEAVEAVGRLDEIDPAACRENAQTRFSAATMARGYAKVYRHLVRGA